MKQTQVVFLTFAAGTSTTTAHISVPFKVKTIYCKSMSLTSGDLGVLGAYVILESDLVNSSPLGSTFNNSSYSSGTIQDTENQFWTPQVIQGQYSFTMKRSNGTLYPASALGGGDKIAMIIEFISPEEIFY